MSQENQNCDEMEIDLSKYVEVLVRRKMTFFVVFLFILIAGIGYILFSPKIYTISTLLQPPVSGEAVTGANDLESAENLKGLIINNAFDEVLSKRLNLDSSKTNFEFKVIIPKKTNILKVSIDQESKKKEFGIIILKNLVDLISESYSSRIEIRSNGIIDQIKQKERAIAKVKEKAKNLQKQINEAIVRENRLDEEMREINANTEQILGNREALLKKNEALDSISIFLLTNFIQNNLSYSNQLSNQSTDLSIRRANLNLEIRNIDFQISDFQMIIDNLNMTKVFISNLRVLSQPRISPSPISPNKKKILALSIFLGLLCGIFMVFVHEFWQKNLKGKINK